MTPPPLPGFQYRQRNGWVTPPVSDSGHAEHPLIVPGYCSWCHDGRYSRDSEDHPFDLVRRVTVTPAKEDAA